MTFAEVFEKYKSEKGDISQAEFSRILGWSTTKVSLLLSEKYAGSEEKVKEAMRKLWGTEYTLDSDHGTWQPIVIDKDVIIRTKDFNGVFSLCNGLVDPNASLTASIGLVTGDAGRGKTTAVKRYAAENRDAAYILYMGYTRAALFKAIADALVGRSYTSYFHNLQLIMECTKTFRKLIIIDEADRIPLPILEDLRTLNEAGLVPLLLVGEPKLASIVRKADRIESRIRRPRIEFSRLDYVTLAALYSEACNLNIDKETAEELLRISDRDFRIAANDMQAVVNFMNVNHISTLSKEIVKEWNR